MRVLRVSLVLAAICCAAPALAVVVGDSQSPVKALTVEQLPVRSLDIGMFFQDVHVMTPEQGGYVDTRGAAVVGVGAQFRQRVGASSSFYYTAGVGYGIGSQTQEGLAGTVVLKDKLDVSYLYGNAGLGAVVPIYGKFQAHGAGRLFYSSAKGKYDQTNGFGNYSADSEPFKVFGIDKSLGMSYQLSNKTYLYGEHYSQFGWGSGDDGPASVKETVKYGCYRGGLSFGF